MATKYGYVARGIENDVNWADISKGFSDDLLAERDSRVKRKKELDDKMYEVQENLKDYDLGQNTDLNDRVIGLSTNGSSFLLSANKDLKSGSITPEQYMRKVQNINSSTDELFKLTTNYNKIYDAHLQRYDKGEASELEVASFQGVDAMTDFNTNDFFVDENGTILLAPLVTDENGVTAIDPSKARSAKAMFNIAQNNVPVTKVINDVSAAAEKVGTWISTTSLAASKSGSGMDITVSDARNMPDYKKMKDKLIGGILNSDIRTASVLADFMDGYKVVNNKAELEGMSDEESEKTILYDISNGREGVAVLTEGQKAAATEELDTLFEGMIDKKYGEESTSQIYASAAEQKLWLGVGREDEDDAVTMNQLALLWGGKNTEDINAAAQYFQGINPNIETIDRNGDGITIVYNIGGKRTTKKVNFNKDFSIFAKSATALTGQKDVSKALEQMDYEGVVRDDNNNIVFNEFAIGGAKGGTPTDESKFDFGVWLKKNIEGKNSVESINSSLMATNFKLVPARRGSGFNLVNGESETTLNNLDLSNDATRKNVSTYLSSQSVVEKALTMSQKVLGAPKEKIDSEANPEKSR